MKKGIALLLATVIMSTCLAACGDKDKKTENGNGEATEVKVDQTDETAETTKEEEAEETQPESNALLIDTAKVPMKDIYYDYPDYHYVEEGFTTAYKKLGSRYVTFTRVENVQITDLQEAHEMAFSMFQALMENDGVITALNVVTESTETINGIEVYKYEGTVTLEKGNGREAYVIGYSFIMHGLPCNITGVLLDKEQPEELITEIRDIVNAMMKTVRTEK